MFKKVWAAFDEAFESMHRAFDNLGADWAETIEDPPSDVPADIVSETTTEVETKPDGTVIRRTKTVRRRATATRYSRTETKKAE